MNTNQENIAQAIKCVGMMYRSLDSLKEEVLPVNPRLFAVMAEGPLDQIRDLLDQIDGYLAAYGPETPSEEVVIAENVGSRQ